MIIIIIIINIPIDIPIHIIHMAHFQLGSFLIELVSNWAQF